MPPVTKGRTKRGTSSPSGARNRGDTSFLDPGPAELAKRIRSVDKVSPYVNALFYGRNKTGKTTLAATAPKCLILDINEEGTRSVAGKGTGAEVLTVTRWEDVVNAYWYLNAGQHSYESIAIDTLTGMQGLALRFCMGEAEDRDPSRPVDMPDQRTWGKAGELMKRWMLDFRNLPVHTIFLAQERVITEEEEGTPFHTIDLSPGSRGTATGSVSVLGRVYRKEVTKVNPRTKREVSTWTTKVLVGSHAEYDAGNRLELPRFLTNPKFTDIIAANESKNTRKA